LFTILNNLNTFVKRGVILIQKNLNAGKQEGWEARKLGSFFDLSLKFSSPLHLTGLQASRPSGFLTFQLPSLYNHPPNIG
jgi:hypothetical protein